VLCCAASLAQTVYISVPDLMVLTEIFLDPKTSVKMKHALMTIIYGGQINEFDYHKIGFYYELMEELLINADFCRVRKVEYFGFFNDSSDLIIQVGLSCPSLALTGWW